MTLTADAEYWRNERLTEAERENGRRRASRFYHLVDLDTDKRLATVLKRGQEVRHELDKAEAAHEVALTAHGKASSALAAAERSFLVDEVVDSATLAKARAAVEKAAAAVTLAETAVVDTRRAVANAEQVATEVRANVAAERLATLRGHIGDEIERLDAALRAAVVINDEIRQLDEFVSILVGGTSMHWWRMLSADEPFLIEWRRSVALDPRRG